MSRKPIFEGAATAIVTPFVEHEVDFKSLEKHVAFLLNNQIDALVVAGTTGESSTMSDEEHMSVVEFVVKQVNKKVPVIAGTGSNDTHHAVRLSQKAEELGADMVLLVPPYYNKTTQKGLLAHFKTISNRIAIPMMLYNIPQRTGMNIDPETMAELSYTDNIAAVKECNMTQVADCVHLCADDFYIYSGDDGNVPTILSFGGKGVVSVLGNIMPKEMHDLVTFYLQNENQKSQQMFYTLYPLMKTMFLETNPIPIKKATQLMGFNNGHLRMPLIEISEDHQTILKKEMAKLNLL